DAHRPAPRRSPALRRRAARARSRPAIRTASADASTAPPPPLSLRPQPRRDVDRFSEAEFAPLLGPEAQRVRELYTEGVLRRVWSRKDVLGAVLLIEADSLEAAQAVLRTLPLAQRDMLGVDAVVPLAAYRGFAPRG